MQILLSDFKEALRRMPPRSRPAQWVSNLEAKFKEIISKPYSPSDYDTKLFKGSNRVLSVPTANDRLIQGAIQHRLGQEWLKLSTNDRKGGKGMHKVVKEIDDFISTTMDFSFFKSDIKSCFNTINQQEVLTLCSKKLNLNKDSWLYKSIVASVTKVSSGIPPGSPLSPTLLEIAMDNLDAAVSSNCNFFMRYADDILILGTKTQVEKSKTILIGELSKLGLSVNLEKTAEGEYPKRGFSVLGNSYPKVIDKSSVIFSTEVGSVAFGYKSIPEERKPIVAIDISKTAESYREDIRTNTKTYSWDHFLDLLVTGVRLPQLELLISPKVIKRSVWGQKLQLLKNDFVHEGFAKAIHSQLLKTYLSHVKKPYVEQGKIDIDQAMKVLRGLCITTELMECGKFPDSWSGAHQILEQGYMCLKEDNYKGYHDIISTLFKKEHKLRVENQHKLPPQMAYGELVMADRDPLSI